MAIYSGITHWKWWFFHSYVSLPEGNEEWTCQGDIVCPSVRLTLARNRHLSPKSSHEISRRGQQIFRCYIFFEVYKQKVVDIFQRISKEVAGDVPLKVINDGEVINREHGAIGEGFNKV